jgi:signal transduction histidine kinase/ligand-binding sensor domain-containing protein
MRNPKPIMAGLGFWILAVFPGCLNICPATPDLTAEPDYITRNWDTEDSLPSSDVCAVAKTRDGLVWVGTSAGLMRYDGFQFSPFSVSAPWLSHISALFVDHRQRLWIGPIGGAPGRLSGGKLEQLALRTGTDNSTTWTFTEDKTGVVWGTLEYGGVFCFRDDGPLFYGTNSGLTSMVWDVTVDNDGGIWVVSKWHLMHFDGEKWNPAEGLSEDFPKVAAIAPARDGGLWIACVSASKSTDRGARVFKYKNGQAVEDTCSPIWPQDSRRSIPRVLMEDRKGRLWMTQRGAGIFFRDQKQWHVFNDSPAQGMCIMEDEDSMIWIGTDGAGLYQVRPRIVATLEPLRDTAPTRKPFWTVFPARDGSMWGGADGNGVFHWKDGAITHFQSEQGLKNQNVNAVIEDRHQNIWAGTMGGLFVLRNGRFEAVTGTPMFQYPVHSLKEDHAGGIWVGTRNGLIQITETATNVFGYAEGIPFGPINAIEEDRAGRVWVSIPAYREDKAQEYGLFAQTGNRFEHITENGKQWAGGPNIRSLHADARGNLWIGTIGTGFFRYHNGRFIEYSGVDGVPHGRIHAVISDDLGNLWCCSELGVFGCPIAQLERYTRGQNARLNFWRVEHAAGLASKTTTGNGQPCAAQGPDGRIWFANGNAIAGFDPRLVTATARLQPPLIEDVLVNGQNVTPQFADRHDATSETPNSKFIHITGPARRVELRYTSPNTTTPDLPNFWIQLKGFDPGWMPGGGARAVSYNLRPGNYKFSVAVTGPDGARLETPNPLRIEVVPQFWERQFVQVLAGLLAVGAIAAGVWRWERLRSQRRLRELEVQRATDEMRQRIARDIHDDLGSGLTEITLLSDNLLSGERDEGRNMKDEDRNANGIPPSTLILQPSSFLQTVRRIGSRARALTHEMDEVVWAINPRTDTLESLATYLNDFAQERLALAGIRCRLNTPVELPNLELSSEVRHSLYRAAKEALNNAIKYSGASEVAITIEAHGKHLVFMIEDNGRGFDARQLKRGNGLKIMRHRLEEIGGRCEIHSRPGEGTSIRFSIPSATNNHTSRSQKNGKASDHDHDHASSSNGSQSDSNCRR